LPPPSFRKFRDKQTEKESAQTRNNINSSENNNNNKSSLLISNNYRNIKDTRSHSGQSRRDIFVRRTEAAAPKSGGPVNAGPGNGGSGNGVPGNGVPGNGGDSGAPQKKSVGNLFRSTGQLLLHPKRMTQSMFCRKISQRNISLPFLQTLV
jgi:hypothetical protein